MTHNYKGKQVFRNLIYKNKLDEFLIYIGIQTLCYETLN